MRRSEWYLLLMAFTAGYAAFVMRLEGAGWLFITLPLAAAVVASVAVMKRAVEAPKVLVVGHDGGSMPTIEQTLDEAGFALRVCAGPEAKPCPVLEGRECPVRGHPQAAIVFRASGVTWEAPCGEALHIPQVTLTEPVGTEDAFVRALRHTVTLPE